MKPDDTVSESHFTDIARKYPNPEFAPCERAIWLSRFSAALSALEESYKFAHCLAWPNGHPKFARTREQTAEHIDTRVILLSIFTLVCRSPVTVIVVARSQFPNCICI